MTKSFTILMTSNGAGRKDRLMDVSCSSRKCYEVHIVLFVDMHGLRYHVLVEISSG